MKKERKIAVIGDPGSVMIFKAIGLDVYYEEQGPMIEKRIHKLADEGYAAIYITEEAAQLVPEAIDYYTTATFPAIIPIPSAKGSLGSIGGLKVLFAVMHPIRFGEQTILTM